MSDPMDEIIDKSIINITEDSAGHSTGHKSKSRRVDLSSDSWEARLEAEGRVIPQSTHHRLNASKSRRDESIMEWFDRSMEEELSKRRQDSMSPKLNLDNNAGVGHQLMVESMASLADLEQGMRGERDTELYDAVDKYARAEAMVAFEGAVKAAEDAAACAPPGQAEEAAVAGAKGYQAELVNTIKQKVPGVKPVEVVGYVGITRPKFAKKTN